MQRRKLKIKAKGLQIGAAFEITNWGKKITNRGKKTANRCRTYSAFYESYMVETCNFAIC